MEDFRQQFLTVSVITLKNLQRNLSNEAELPEAQRREIFRTLHTIKGTAQTFGFSAASRVAHELENVISVGNVLAYKDFQSLFAEGIEYLISSVENHNFQLPAQFVEKVHRIIPQDKKTAAEIDIILPHVPNEIFENLSRTEKIALDSAFAAGKSFYIIEVGLAMESFTVELKEFQKTLNTAGEVAAVFPGAKFDSKDKIGFRLVYVSSAEKTQVEKIAKPYAATIIFDVAPEVFTDDLRGIVSKAAAHGKNLARKLDKSIEFVISADWQEQSAAKLKLIFDILLHLVRNAVDHAAEKSGGKIEITAQPKKNGLQIIVADNGKGVDTGKIKAKAIEKHIISADADLTERTTLDLIFQSELSTAPQITEISGRGIGLDAVRNAVEKAGGTISVNSRTGQGTSFEIFLPS